jgi:hypothetical protein
MAMAEFNVSNSKIEQMNDTGDNVKITGNQGSVAITKDGQIAQTSGTGNTVEVNKPQSNWLKKLWNWIKTKLFGAATGAG